MKKYLLLIVILFNCFFIQALEALKMEDVLLHYNTETASQVVDWNQIYRIEDWVRIGVERSPKIRADYFRWRAQLSQIKKVKYLPDPSVSWTYFVEEIQTRTGPQQNRIQLTQSLPWFGILSQRARIEKQQSQIVWNQTVQTYLDTVLSIKKIFYELGNLGQEIQIIGDNLELLKQLESIIQRKIQVGSDQSSLIRLQVEIGKVQDLMKSLEQKKPVLLSQFKAILGIDFNANLSYPKLTKPVIQTYSFEDLLALIYNNNPQLMIYQQKVQLSQNKLKLAHKEILPQWSIGVSWIETQEAMNPETIGSGDDPIGVMLGISLPFWFGKNRAITDQVNYIIEADQSNYENYQNQIYAELKYKIFQLEDSIRQIHLYENTLIPKANQSYEVTLIAYQSGKATILDLIDAERILLEFEKVLWRAVANYQIILAEIENICGGKLP